MTPTGAPLPDGVYDAFVVDADEVDGGRRLELAIVAGEHKGELLAVQAIGWTDDPIDLIGMPATLTVAGGTPTVAIDPP